MTSVNSLSIRAVGFDAETSQLEVEYHSGQSIVFDGVEAHHYHQLVRAADVAGYVATHLTGHYKSERLKGPCPRIKKRIDPVWAAELRRRWGVK